MLDAAGSPFDDLDAALQSGTSEKPVAVRREVLATKLPPGSAPNAGHQRFKVDFDKLSKPNAQRLLRFWQVREVSARSV
jgi:hypothetical protein